MIERTEEEGGMTSKERLQTAMEHGEPDRVPYMASFVPEVEMELKSRYASEIAEHP